MRILIALFLSYGTFTANCFKLRRFVQQGSSFTSDNKIDGLLGLRISPLAYAGRRYEFFETDQIARLE
jgi:hypothetical protein